MSRVQLEKGKQGEFINWVYKYFNNDWSKLADVVNISHRTLRDWRIERYRMDYAALLRFHEVSNVPIPRIKEILPEYWSVKKASRLGGIKCNILHGNPGTVEGRRKGGFISQQRHQIKSDTKADSGFRVLKNIKHPRKSALLAEFVGALLGDGCIAGYQARITFNRRTDKEYAIYLHALIKRLFGLSAVDIAKRSDKGKDVVISSKRLVDFLEKIAFPKGNKVKHQVDIPAWIFEKKEYRIACLRGLVDTDGSFYSYKHKESKTEYVNFAMGFANESKPLLRSFLAILRELKFSPSTNGRNRVYLYRRLDIDRYFKIIGSNNFKHLKKYKLFSNDSVSSGGVPKWS